VKRRIRTRYWYELAGAVLSALLFAVTLVWPNWIELLFEAEPDAGSGELEWLIAGAFLALTVAFSILARREQHQAVIREN